MRQAAGVLVLARGSSLPARSRGRTLASYSPDFPGHSDGSRDWREPSSLHVLKPGA
ncbi:hypothetical protein [Haladaptatus sp. DFWS20]|uniref:hypothetical protein n=1 Tax=Haladaptatus sp. DFWS20 TaxID=3403467 RepID=UPI003EBAF820